MSDKIELSNICENPPIAKQDPDEIVKERKFVENNSISSMPKEAKSRYGILFYNKSSCYNKNTKLPHSRKKFVPTSNCLADASTKVVLSERNVEIKDLESKVKFLKNKIKELENENKTLQSVLSKQERELRKFKEGVTDIPALLRSHKEETKAYESTISSIRKELKDCQKELKLRNESVLKKENKIDKLNDNLKQSEKLVLEYSSEIKLLKTAKLDAEEVNKNLNVTNENLRNKNDGLCKQIKDLILKTQNLKEDLNKESDLNKNLKSELNELKEKCENKLLQVSNEENRQGSGSQIHCETEDNISSKVLLKSSSVNSEGKEIEEFANSVIGDVDEQNPCNTKSVEKKKDALIHTFKCYQEFCHSKLKKADATLFETGLSNIKLLSPLKTPSKESSTSTMPNFGKRECFSSAADMNFTDSTKYFKHNASTKDCLRKFSVDKCAIDESKASISHDSTMNEKNSCFDLALNGSKYLQNRDFKKDIECVEKTYFNELKMSKKSSFILKDIETNKYERVSTPLKIRDYSSCENLKVNLQNLLENHSVLDKNLEKKNFTGSSKNVSEWESSMNGKDVEYKFNTDKPENPKHRRTFLKQTINTKPITFCYFDELSEQK